jgi:hypothetical protein
VVRFIIMLSLGSSLSVCRLNLWRRRFTPFLIGAGGAHDGRGLRGDAILRCCSQFSMTEALRACSAK